VEATVVSAVFAAVVTTFVSAVEPTLESAVVATVGPAVRSALGRARNAKARAGVQATCSCPRARAGLHPAGRTRVHPACARSGASAGILASG
jgi:hypothetical protein